MQNAEITAIDVPDTAQGRKARDIAAAISSQVIDGVTEQVLEQEYADAPVTAAAYEARHTAVRDALADEIGPRVADEYAGTVYTSLQGFNELHDSETTEQEIQRAKDQAVQMLQSIPDFELRERLIAEINNLPTGMGSRTLAFAVLRRNIARILVEAREESEEAVENTLIYAFRQYDEMYENLEDERKAKVNQYLSLLRAEDTAENRTTMIMLTSVPENLPPDIRRDIASRVESMISPEDIAYQRAHPEQAGQAMIERQARNQGLERVRRDTHASRADRESAAWAETLGIDVDPHSRHLPQDVQAGEERWMIQASRYFGEARLAMPQAERDRLDGFTAGGLQDDAAFAIGLMRDIYRNPDDDNPRRDAALNAMRGGNGHTAAALRDGAGIRFGTIVVGRVGFEALTQRTRSLVHDQNLERALDPRLTDEQRGEALAEAMKAQDPRLRGLGTAQLNALATGIIRRYHTEYGDDPARIRNATPDQLTASATAVASTTIAASIQHEADTAARLAHAGDGNALAEATGRSISDVLMVSSLRMPGLGGSKYDQFAQTVDGAQHGLTYEQFDALRSRYDISWQQIAGLSGGGDHRDITVNEMRGAIGYIQGKNDIEVRFKDLRDAHGRLIFDQDGNGHIALTEIRRVLQQSNVSLDTFQNIGNETQMLEAAMTAAVRARGAGTPQR